MDYCKYMEYYNENNTYMRYNGMKLVVLKRGYAEVELELNDNSLSIQGILHGGAIFTLADAAAGAAAKSYGIVCVTLNSNINFIKSTKTGKVKAIAKEIHQGETIGDYRVNIIDENNNMLAWCTFTMFFTGVVIEI